MKAMLILAARAPCASLVALALAGCGGVTSKTPFDYGAKGNAVKLIDGAITSGQATFTSPSVTFSTADVRKAISVTGAGPTGSALNTTIATFTSSTAVELADSASTTVTAALTYYGTDDTVALRSCIVPALTTGGHCRLNDGAVFMQSNTASTIFIGGKAFVRPGGLLDGRGRIVFAPRGILTTYFNDRAIYIQSGEGAPQASISSLNPKPIMEAIASGATSFTALQASDTAILNAGDWVQVTEVDAGEDDIAYIDWEQAASVSGTTVNVLTPFRMSFPNLRAFNISGTPAPCVPARPCGLSFGKISPIVQDLTIRDITFIIPGVFDGTNGAVAIVTHSTRGLTIENVTCSDASGNCFAFYKDQGLRFQGNHSDHIGFIDATDEFAAQTDLVIAGNDYSQPPSPLNGFAGPTNSCLLIDIGTGFFNATGNSCAEPRNEAYVIEHGVHDGQFSGNTAGELQPGILASGIALVGTYRVAVFDNTLIGATGSATGVSTADETSFTVNILSDSNLVFNNRITGFTTADNCKTALGTDVCTDRLQ